MAMGAAVLAGWTLDTAGLESLGLGSTVVKANTAVGLVLAGLALWCAPRRRGRVAAAALVLLAVLTLAEFATGRELGIDQLLFVDRDTASPGPGRMALNTALGFLLLGTALLGVYASSRRWHRGAEVASGLVALFALPTVVGRLLGVDLQSNGVEQYLRMAWATALALGILSIGVVAAVPDGWVVARATDRGTVGIVARRLVPITLIATIGPWWLNLLGQDAGLYSPRFGDVLDVLLPVALLLLGVGWSLATLERIEEGARTAREAVRQRDERFRDLVEHSWDSITVLDADGTITYASPATRRAMGYAANEFTGRNAFELIAPESRELVAARMTESRGRPGEQVPVHARLLHKDGSWRFFEGIFTNLLDKPAVRGIVANIRDMTDQRRADEAVRWLTLAVDQGPAAVLMTDPTGNIEYVNRKFAEMTGYSLEDVRGKKPSLLGSGLTPRAQYQQLWATILSGNTYRGELQNRRKNGELFWNEVQISPVRDHAGAISHFLGVQADVTTRKQAETALEEAVARYRGITEASFDAISISQGGIVREVNTGFVETFGLGRPEDALGRPALDFVAEESKAEAAGRIGRGDEGTYEFVGRRLDGTTVLLEATARKHEIDGVPTRITAFRDITDARALAQQFLQSQKMESVGLLAGGIAHDFNNLLTVILSYSDMLLADLPATFARREDLEEIRNAASSAADLTRQLLAFSRKQILEPVVLSPNELITKLDKMMRRLIGEDIELRLALSPDVGNVRVDPGQLEQAIVNLVVNARDAMPTGGTLVVETSVAEHPGLHSGGAGHAPPGPYVQIAVTDSGDGMDEALRARIFEPFFTTKEKGRGTGLGLSTVYGIVKQSGGFLFVYSEPGQGSTFKIYLPVAPEEEPPSGEQRRPAATLTGTETILLAEDDAALRRLSVEILRRLGYQVLEADSADAALAAAGAHEGPVALLVTDVVMPRASGRDLARRLHELRPETRVLYTSGYTDDAIVRHGMLEPSLAFLQKPFTPSALARKVREVLDAP